MTKQPASLVPVPSRVTAGEIARVVLVMMAAAAAMNVPLLSRFGSVLPHDLGDPLLNAFILGWDADRILHGLKGLWDAPFYFPRRDTLAYSEHLLGIAFFTAPIQWLTGNPVLAYNAAHLGSYVLAGVGMYLLARSLWGRADAAWVAALAFACAPYRAAQGSHLQSLYSGWMPIGLWALHQYFLRRSRVALAVFAAAFVLQALSNGYFLYFFAIPAAIVVAAEMGRALLGWRRDGAGWRRPLGTMLLDLGVAAVAILAALAPVAAAYVRVREGVGLRRVIEEIEGYSAVLGDYLTRPAALWVWQDVLAQGRAERELFPGLLVVALTLVAIAVSWRRPPIGVAGPVEHDRRRFYTWLYAAILVLAVWLSLGPGAVVGPYRLLLAVLPGLDGLRVPTRVAAVVSLALAVLAGGAAAWIGARLRPRVAVVAALVLAAVVAVEGYPGPIATPAVDPFQIERRDLNAWIEQGGRGGVLELPIAQGAQGPFTLVYQFNTLFHGRPIVNGYSGHEYHLQYFLAGPPSPLRELAQITPMLRALRRIGVRTLVMHPDSYEAWMNYNPAPIIALIDEDTDQVVEARNFKGGTRAWRLADIDPLPVFRAQAWTRLDPSSLEVTAWPADGDTPRLTDGNADTVWDSGMIQRGDEWIRIGLDRPRELVALKMDLPLRELDDYPRELRVEGEAEDGARVELFSGSVLAHVMTSLVSEPRRPGITLTLRPNRVRAIYLRQLGRTRHAHWSIAALSLWERVPALSERTSRR
jgi:hypothetical protein